MDFITFDNADTLSREDETKPIRSWSQFSMYMRCPELYRATYVDKAIPRKSNINMHLGSSVHYAHEKLSEHKRDTGQVLPLDEVTAAADDFWEKGKDKLEDSPSELLTSRAKMIRAVEAYYYYFSQKDLRPQHIEKNVIVYPKGYPFGLRGIIDRVDEGGILVDLKTSSKSPPKSRTTGEYYLQGGTGYDMQLDTYAYLMREGLGIDPTSAKLEFVVKSKNPKVVEVSYQIREDRISSVLDLMANLEENIQQGVFPKNRLGNFCNSYMCDNWIPCTGIVPEPDILNV